MTFFTKIISISFALLVSALSPTYSLANFMGPFSVSTVIDLIRQNQMERPELSFSAIRPGLALSGSDWGVWGHVESVISDQKGLQKGYNVAGIKTFFLNYPMLDSFSLSGYFGQNSNYYFRPTDTTGLNLNLNVIPDKTIVILGWSQDRYQTETTLSQFQYSKMGLIQSVAKDLRLWFTYQVINQKIFEPLTSKPGANQALLLEWKPNAEQAFLVGYSTSCLGENVFCFFKKVDTYTEFNFIYKQKITLFDDQNHPWWVNFQITPIIQTAQFNTILWNNESRSDSKSFHSLYALLGSTYVF